MIPKPIREEDYEWVSYVMQQSCEWCRASGPTKAHHVHRRGAGGSDYSCIPLCPECHAKIHSPAAPERDWEWRMLAEFLMRHIQPKTY
jgi:hypothetical protein